LAKEINWDIVLFMLSISLLFKAWKRRVSRTFWHQPLWQQASFHWLWEFSHQAWFNNWGKLHEQLAHDNSGFTKHTPISRNWTSLNQLGFQQHHRQQFGSALLPTGVIGYSNVARNYATKRSKHQLKRISQSRRYSVDCASCNSINDFVG